MRGKVSIIFLISMFFIMLLNEIFFKLWFINVLVLSTVMVFLIYIDFIKPTLIRKKAKMIELEAKQGDILKDEIIRIIGLICIGIFPIRRMEFSYVDIMLLILIVLTISEIVVNYYFNNTVLISKNGIMLNDGLIVSWEDISNLESVELDYRIKYRFQTKINKDFSIILKNEDDKLKLLNICNEHYL